MKKPMHLIFLLALTGMLFSWPSWAATVRVEVVHYQDRYQPGGRYPVLFSLSIAEPWSIHSTAEEEDLIPTTLTFPEHPDLSVEGIRFPDPEKKKPDFSSGPIEVFSGDLLVRASLVVGENAGAGSREIKGTLAYQACSDRACLPPEKVSVPVSLTIAPPGSATQLLNQELFVREGPKGPADSGSFKVRAGTGLWLTLLGIFLGGLALNLTPCIYPLIPIIVSYFSGRSDHMRGHTLCHVLLYMAGLALTNSLLGVSAALSGGLLGSALQHPLALIAVSSILFVLGLSFFGFWEFRLPSRLTRAASRDYKGFIGTFFFGLTLGIVAAPCIGPFLLGLLTYVGQKGNPFLGFFYFFILSIGLGLPLSVLALFSGAVDRLPVSGEWMIWVRKFMGWVLIGMASYMIGPLIPREMGKSILQAGLAILAAIHLGLIDRSGRGYRSFVFFKRGVSLLLVGGALLFVLVSGTAREQFPWIPYGQDRTFTAAKEKKPFILDFYAEWCRPCQAMERNVFQDPEVIGLSDQFTTVRIDLSKRQPFQDDILKRYRIRGVPTLVFLNRDGVEEKELRIESYTGKGEVLERMKRLLEKSPPFQK